MKCAQKLETASQLGSAFLDFLRPFFGWSSSSGCPVQASSTEVIALMIVWVLI
jgi:hypothetical protein